MESKMFRRIVTPENGASRAALRLANHRAAQAERLANAPHEDDEVPSRQYKRKLARINFKARVREGKREWMQQNMPGGMAAITRARVRQAQA
jgi:hypothetical protein